MRALFLFLMLAGCTGRHGATIGRDKPQDADAARTFEFAERYGLDCAMMGPCATGYVASGGWLYAYEDRGTPVRTDSARFDEADWQALDALLRDGGFFEAPPRVPAMPTSAGGRTLTLRYTPAPGGQARETTFHVDAQTALPEWAYALEASLRRFFQERMPAR